MFDIKSVFKKICELSSNKKHLVSDVFFDLAPVDEIENGDEYINALDYALNDLKVYNIALTGPFGSGKSSIIDAYLKRKMKKSYIKRHILRISMASFTGLTDTSHNNSDSSSNGNNDVNLKIEQGIFKQLFYKVRSSKIPQSRYRKLHKINVLPIILYLFAVLLVVFLLIYVFLNETFDSCVETVQKVFNSLLLSKTMTFVACSFFIILIFAMLLRLIASIISKIKVTGLSVGDAAKISVDQNDMDSSFDKNNDEIMYFFESMRQIFDAYSLTSVKDLKSAMLSALCDWNGMVLTLNGHSGNVPSISILDDDFDIQQLIDGQYHQVTYKTFDNGNSKPHRINNDTLKKYCRRIKDKELLTIENLIQS